MSYELEPDVKAKVLNIIADYPAYEERAKKKAIMHAVNFGEDADDMYYTAATIRFGLQMPSKTNSITDRVADRATFLADHRDRIADEASSIINAVERGLYRAADENKKTGEFARLYEDLWSYVVYKAPAERLNRKDETMKKYKRFALYYIAEELGLVSREEKGSSSAAP